MRRSEQKGGALKREDSDKAIPSEDPKAVLLTMPNLGADSDFESSNPSAFRRTAGMLAESLVELRRHVGHLRGLRSRATSAQPLRRDLSLHNDVLFSLIRVGQCVVAVAAELGGRRDLRFSDDLTAVQSLASTGEVPSERVSDLVLLVGFCDVAISNPADLDLDRAVEAMDRLDAVEELVRRVAGLLSEEEG